MERFISAEEVVANALTVCTDADDKAKNIMKQWVYLGIRDIGVALEDITDCELGVEEGSFKKPDNLLLLDDIAIFDAAGNEYQYVYRGPGRRIHKATEVISSFPIELSEDDYYIHMGSSGSNITRAVLRYYALPIDEYGDIVVKESYLLPLVHFIGYMWNLSIKDKYWTGFYKNMWDSFLLKAKAKNRAVHPMAMEALASKINSMIQKRFSKNF